MSSFENFEQQHLVKAIFGHGDADDFDARGIDVYRRNLAASAFRALAISFPTINLLLGPNLLSVLTLLFLRDRGRGEFDWGLWGGDFPRWLAEHPVSEEHPYLEDSARLDWAMHLCGRSVDINTDLSSLALLRSDDSYQTHFVFAPGATMIFSAYPIVEIYLQHGKTPDQPDLTGAQHKLQKGTGQIALVWRQGWRTRVREPRSKELFWLRLLASPMSLGCALDIVNEESETLEQWLPRAVEDQLLVGLERRITPN